MPSLTVNVDFKFKNKRAVRAFAVALAKLEELAEGNEWNTDLQRAVRAGRYAMKRLRPRMKRE